MIYYKDSDIAVDDEGDFELEVVKDSQGNIVEIDFALAQDFDCTIDDIVTAVKSQKNSSDIWPDFGADLEELVGQPNTREVGEEGRDRIIAVLADNGIVNPADLMVIPIPSGDTIVYYIVVERSDGEEEIIEYPLSLGG